VITESDKQTSAVCLLDDDPSVLKSTGRLLDSAGWKVECFSDPVAFLDHARMFRPGVAVIDILMPKMNGLEVQTRLRNISPATRVIILTSKDDPNARSSALTGGASAFFIKGVENKEFLAGVESAFEHN
jgi:FixJ family two-component response regulator